MKRILDLWLALLGLVLLSPLLVVVAMAIKLADGGSVFYSQLRVGQFGKPFRIRKFRTMVPQADQIGLLITADGDPRITRLGRWLRKTKLDELPQLWNVVVGEMSFVGPRPEVPHYVALYDNNQQTVLELKPGITDPASIAFIDEEALLSQAEDPDQIYCEKILPEKIVRNMEYAEHATFLSDLAVIGMTFRKIIRRPAL